MDHEVDGNPQSVPTRYSTAALVVHWFSALLILSQIIIGLTFGDMPRSPARGQLFAWHKTVGVAILLLAVVRIAIRLLNPPPPLPAVLPRWQREAAVWTHRIFYFLIFALPLTGLSLVSEHAVGGMTDLLGGLKFPAISLGPVGETHSLLAWGLIGLLVLHVAAALKHQFVDGPLVSRRMSPLGPAPDSLGRRQ